MNDPPTSQPHVAAPVERHLSLIDLIARLEREDPDRVLPLGFANPHSYRGDYMDLAFEPVRDISIGDMLAAARSALGETFEGWKGGDYTMGEHTSCWIAERGDSSDNQLGPLLLDLMLRQGEVADAFVRYQKWTAEVGNPRDAVQRVRDLCDRANSMTGCPFDDIEDPTPIPGWTTLVLNAIDGESASPEVTQ